MSRWFCAWLIWGTVLTGCGSGDDPEATQSSSSSETSEHSVGPKSGVMAAGMESIPVPLDYAKTFSLTRVGDVWVVDLQASIATWGGAADGPEQRAQILLVPKNTPMPDLSGTLADAQVLRIPVDRIAVNMAPFEAMLTALDVDDRLVAVGGPKSYNDDIRQRVLAGEIAQIGYGWHMPPVLDALLGAAPDVLLMSMGDLSHAAQMTRIRGLDVPVFPMFINSEPHYLGKVEYLLLMGLLTGRYGEAQVFVESVVNRVDALKAAAAQRPTKSVISAWYSGSGRWMATVRNSEAALLRDANGRNLLEEPDDPRRDEFQKLSTEQIILQGAEAECAILRDSHSQAFTDQKTLALFRAYRDGCVFAIDGMNKPKADAFDYYEGAVLRPDRVLADLVHMLHPELPEQGPFQYIQPDTQMYDH